MILLKNCTYISPEGSFMTGDILIDGENILQIDKNISIDTSYTVYDAADYKVLPGFIDIHMHGALGFDMMSASPEQISSISEHLVKEGTTSFFPTTITSSEPDLEKTIESVKLAANMNKKGACIEGIHIEGPYISSKQKGCHDTTKMKLPNIEEYKSHKSIADGMRLHYTVAPELEGALEFILQVTNNNDTISIGHTDADYEVVNAAINSGASIFTHLFNAMKGVHHREPGVAGTALASDSYVELICDGVHVHPQVVNLVYKTKGKDKIVLVTDAMQATGLGDGQFYFGGFTVIVKDGVARKEDGALASSTLSMYKSLKNMMKFTSASLEEVTRMATLNPAKAVGIDSHVGSITVGKKANLVILDEQLNIKDIFIKGNIV